jgi:hypothetical protein
MQAQTRTRRIPQQRRIVTARLNGGRKSARIIRLTEEQVRAILDRVSGWPAERQQELIRVVLEIEVAMAGAPYDATPDELKAIDEGLDGETASEDEISAAFARWQIQL